ncbi:MAG TPA: cell division protein FtsZ, partial [Kofleriaceae bacterium]|nr:cell division protein FtsZ [Kofleriaceae bacterium]
LLSVAGQNTTMLDAFRKVDEVLLNAVQGISDLIIIHGFINVDFADVRTIMAGMGRALMGTGIGSGKRRATEAAETAISSPLLEDVSIEGATGILINITGGPDLTLHEVNEASSLIQQAAHEDANIIFGSVIDPNLSDEVRITVIATGFDRSAKTQVIVEPQTTSRGTTTKPQQITLPYDQSTQITKEYPPPVPPRTPAKPAARIVDGGGTPAGSAAEWRRGSIDEPEIHFEWAQPDLAEVNAVERALADLDPVPEGEASQKLASGSGPAPADGAPLVGPDRKRAQSRPSMKAVLAGEIDTESELDVPTFIRRHSATHG